jgi:hypothetical protein
VPGLAAGEVLGLFSSQELAEFCVSLFLGVSLRFLLLDLCIVPRLPLRLFSFRARPCASGH